VASSSGLAYPLIWYPVIDNPTGAAPAAHRLERGVIEELPNVGPRSRRLSYEPW
jgi:hypothetical protein